jgi:Sec-independent protein translocase protein TatA
MRRSNREKKKDNYRTPAAGEMFGSGLREIKRRLKVLDKAKAAPSPTDYQTLLDAWDLTAPGAPEKAAADQKRRICLFGLIGLLGAATLVVSGGPAASTLALLPAGLGLLTGFWRLSLLKRKRFVSFGSWLGEILRFRARLSVEESAMKNEENERDHEKTKEERDRHESERTENSRL